MMNDNNEAKIDLTKYFDYFYRTVMKHKKLFIVIIVVMMAVFEIREFFFFDTTYSSEAVFVVHTQDQDNIFATSDDNDDMFTTFNGLMTGSMMRQIIQDGLGISLDNVNISLTKITDTNLVDLKVTAADGETAYHVANCILNNYTQVTNLVMSDVQISLLDTPKVASAPDAYPDYLKNGILGIGTGIAISFVISLIIIIFRHTVIDGEDVKKVLHLSNMTRIPYINARRKRKGKKLELLLSNPRIQYTFRQSFHDLRLRIEQEKKKKGSQVFMVCSVLPNEGKTMTASNIAISLAEKGHGVVLVDLDLRNPSLKDTLDAKDIKGSIAGYLKGEDKIEEIINQYQDYQLDVIYGTSAQEEATELLSRGELEQLIKVLKANYDYVILDVAPLYILEDALIISKHVDTGIVVIKQDHASEGDLLESL